MAESGDGRGNEDLRQLGEIANHARPESLRQPWFVHMPPLSLRNDDIAVCKGNEVDPQQRIGLLRSIGDAGGHSRDGFCGFKKMVPRLFPDAQPVSVLRTQNRRYRSGFEQSARLDLNQRPFGPQPTWPRCAACTSVLSIQVVPGVDLLDAFEGMVCTKAVLAKPVGATKCWAASHARHRSYLALPRLVANSE